MGGPDSTSVDVGTRRPKRPRGVTAVVALGLLQALLFLAGGSILIVQRTNTELLDDTQAISGTVLAAGLILVGIGLLGGAFALALARGSSLARNVIGAVTAIQTSMAVYALIALRDLEVGSVWSLSLSLAVLWFLYGSSETEEFFSR